MDRKYTDCSTEELYRFYLEDFFELPDNGRSFTDELKQEAKYEEDFKFRTAVDFLSLISHAVITPMDKLLSDTMDMLERTTALEQWQFVAHCWNIIATLYSQVRMYERAVECFTRATLIESRHGLSSITLVAYFNMSIIFYEMELYKRALEYSKKSNEILKEHHQSNKIFKSKLFNNYCISLQIISSMEAGEAEQEGADKIYEELRSFDLTGFPNYQICHYYTTLFLYQLVLYGKGKCAFEECRTLFLKAGEYVNRGREFEIAPYYFVYVYSCMKREVDPKLFEEEIRLLEQVLPTSQPKINMECIELIIDYYKLTGNVSKVEEWKDLYIEALRATVADQKEQQKNSVELVETLLLDAGISNEVGSQNSELKILYREALKIKGQLQEAYHRIESINKIGRQLTATSNLNEVITEFHEVLKEHFEVDSFALLVADFEKNQLRTQIFSYNGALQPEATIDFDDSDSLSAECFRTNKIICLERKNDAIVKRLKMKESIPMHSAVYLPLSVEDRVIGVYTIQHRDYDVYKQDLEFLEALAPFFSIALNNALRSWGLEKEIHSHIITQNQLEIANKNLVRISLLDGLTHISSRRDFENRFIGLINQANLTGSTVSTFMIDVDNFKLYNDTYGHLEGDEVLKSVANIFKNHMDLRDGLSARFGGEEFVGACTGLTFEESQDLAERIRACVYDLNIKHIHSPLGRLTVSIGVSFAKGIDSSRKSELMRLADVLLYHAKNSGKNRVVIDYLNRSE